MKLCDIRTPPGYELVEFGDGLYLYNERGLVVKFYKGTDPKLIQLFIDKFVENCGEP